MINLTLQGVPRRPGGLEGSNGPDSVFHVVPRRPGGLEEAWDHVVFCGSVPRRPGGLEEQAPMRTL